MLFFSDRELEIRELRKSIMSSQERNIVLAKQFEEIKVEYPIFYKYHSITLM